MATLSVQVATPMTLITPTFSAAAGGGDAYAPTGKPCLLYIKNAHSGSWVLTFNDPTSVSPVGALAFNPDVSFTVPNASERVLQMDFTRFTNPANGLIEWTYSGVTALSVAVISLT